ncbi:MAG: TatD family hydrolase [Candidatus Spechtbacterales bacterium]
MFIDTHAHLNFSAFEADFTDVLKSALNSDMGIIMPGTQYESSKKGVELSEKLNDGRVWAAVGLHPIHLESGEADSSETKTTQAFYKEEFNKDKYFELAKSPQTVAVGEVGLDYWNRPKNKEEGSIYAQKQIETLKMQLDLALELKKPVILHCRVAHKDMLRLLAEHPITNNPPAGGPGVIHSYTGSVKQLNKFLKMGYCIGINGLVFKLDLMADAVKAVPLERMLLETDSPYLTPPEAGDLRNEPVNIKYIARRVAELKGIALQEIEKQTTENSKRVFGVDFSVE